MANTDVTIKNFAFSPSEVSVAKGDTVTWTNQDNAAHTVTADNGEFDSGDLAKTDPPFVQPFDTAGVFPYHCEHHHNMTGKVTVTEPAAR